MPIVYVTEMEPSVEFYERLGFEPSVRSRSAMWTELAAGDRAILALHGVAPDGLPPERGRVELALTAQEPLEELVRRLEHADVRIARGIADESFGRSVVIEDPDGLPIQVNEHEHALYT